MDVDARFRFEVQSCLFLGKFIQAMLTHGRQPDSLDSAASGIEGIVPILSLPLEPALVEPEQFFVERMAMTLRSRCHFI